MMICFVIELIMGELGFDNFGAFQLICVFCCGFLSWPNGLGVPIFVGHFRCAVMHVC
jgi:hypothetical protein